MNCPKCGKELKDGDKFCTGCGTKIGDGAAGYPEGAAEPENNAGNASFGEGGNAGSGISFGSSKTMIRRYFFGFSDMMWLSILAAVIFSALGLSFLRTVAVIAFFASIGLTIYITITGAGKSNVDTATQRSIEMLRERAFDKFNVDSEQIGEVAPIHIAGEGASPDELGVGLTTNFKHINQIAKIYTKDPIKAYRISLDGAVRCLLIQATVYAFTDTQLLVYSGNVDISTGTIYKESVAEIFYKDINGVTQTDVLKKFRVGLFKKQYYTLKNVEFDICGIIKTAAFDSNFVPDAETSLRGMESYIREKKF